MTDRELLEAAARAAGHEVVREADSGPGAMLRGEQEPWSPLTDDGDAFRLSVNLNMVLDIDGGLTCARAGESNRLVDQRDAADPCAAARRAIVRAAAALDRAALAPSE